MGLLFIFAMLFGIVDAYFVAPKMNAHLSDLHQIRGTILLGVFSIFFMAIGIARIATTLFSIVRRQSDAIATTYVSFRIVECILLMLGAMVSATGWAMALYAPKAHSIADVVAHSKRDN